MRAFVSDAERGIERSAYFGGFSGKRLLLGGRVGGASKRQHCEFLDRNDPDPEPVLVLKRKPKGAKK